MFVRHKLYSFYHNPVSADGASGELNQMVVDDVVATTESNQMVIDDVVTSGSTDQMLIDEDGDSKFFLFAKK